jgi:amino acid transporter
MTGGDVIVLSGVFSVAFLMVLICFASANIMLKLRRPRLPRGAHASWSSVVLGWCVMAVGLIGNVMFNAYLLIYFLIYLAFYFSVIFLTFQRVQLAKFLLFLVKRVPWLERRYAKQIIQLLIHMKVRVL